MEPAELHDRVRVAFNNGDVDALVGLYEDDASLFGGAGPVKGREAIRATWAEFVAMGGQLEMETLYAVEHDDIAMMSNRWTMTIGSDVISAVTAEVARRQPDGTWRYVIDNP